MATRQPVRGPDRDPDPLFYSPEELSRRIFIPAPTIYRWCQDGVIAAAKIGRHWLIPCETLDEIRKRARDHVREAGGAP